MDSLSKKLARFGFTEYESKAYSVLLSGDLLTANELGKLAKIPHGRIYSILNTLEAKGLCITFPGAVKKFKAVNPKAALKDLIENKKKALDEMITIKEELEKEFETKKTNNTPLDYIQILTSKQSQVAKFDELIKVSKSSLYSFNKPPYATGFKRNLKEIDKASAPLKKIINEGTRVKALFEAEKVEIEAFIDMIQYYDSIGEEVRIYEKLPLKMLLSDNEKVMVSLRNAHGSSFKLTSMIVEHSDLTTALADLFEVYWEKALTLDAYLNRQQISTKE